jgi:hypothetical protein
MPVVMAVSDAPQDDVSDFASDDCPAKPAAPGKSAPALHGAEIKETPID